MSQLIAIHSSLLKCHLSYHHKSLAFYPIETKLWVKSKKNPYTIPEAFLKHKLKFKSFKKNLFSFYKFLLLTQQEKIDHHRKF